ncbi:hypothetical protein CYMTET_38675 [Cymbomonas tetramitiformis]|uniref:Uncharacterized protein n=1 Tax=Cymbomonas tetramitiformis TaxID=36881 RepID=A0AAE0CBJ4_9CHLO|nr:hypothetical protein CYMTET_38675 [Cymbomonas tetramitiformis]
MLLGAWFAAAEFGLVEVMRELLEKGAEVDADDGEGRTALTVALAFRQEAAARALLEAGAGVNAGTGRRPLLAAAEKGLMEMVRELVGKGAEVDAEDREGRTALTGPTNGQPWPSWKNIIEEDKPHFSCKEAEAFAVDVGGLTPLWVRGHQDENGEEMLPNRFLALLNHRADCLANGGVHLAEEANAAETVRVRYPRGGPRFFMAHMGSMVTSDPSVFVRKQGEVSALAAWGRCKQQGAAAAALDDLWIESLDPSRLRGLKAPGGVAINGLPDPGSEFFRICAWRQWTAVGGSWSARVRDSSQLRAAMLTLLQAKGVGSTHVGEGAMPAVAGEGMDHRGSYLPGGETSLNEGARAFGSSGSDPPTVGAAVDDLLSSTPSSMLGGEGEGTRIKAEVRAFLNGLSHLLLEDEELGSEVRQGVDGFFEQLPSMSWGRGDSAGEARGAVEEMAKCLPPLARGCPSLGTGTQEAVDTFLANLSQSLLDNDGGGKAANAASASGLDSGALGTLGGESGAARRRGWGLLQ